jgi:hypothetical protein
LGGASSSSSDQTDFRNVSNEKRRKGGELRVQKKNHEQISPTAEGCRGNVDFSESLKFAVVNKPFECGLNSPFCHSVPEKSIPENFRQKKQKNGSRTCKRMSIGSGMEHDPAQLLEMSKDAQTMRLKAGLKSSTRPG